MYTPISDWQENKYDFGTKEELTEKYPFLDCYIEEDEMGAFIQTIEDNKGTSYHLGEFVCLYKDIVFEHEGETIRISGTLQTDNWGGVGVEIKDEQYRLWNLH